MTKLQTDEPQYEIDPQTGLYVVKQWKGVVQVANQETRVEPVNPTVSPTGKPVLPQWLVIVLTVLAAAAGVAVVIPGVPAWVPAVGAGVTAVTAAFGIASPGLRSKTDTKP